jgi:hypothetical protein
MTRTCKSFGSSFNIQDIANKFLISLRQSFQLFAWLFSKNNLVITPTKPVKPYLIFMYDSGHRLFNTEQIIKKNFLTRYNSII